MKKRCSGCRHWIKWRNSTTYRKQVGNQSLGLCDLKDMRCGGDHHCDKWQGVVYDRSEQKDIIIRSIACEKDSYQAEG